MKKFKFTLQALLNHRIQIEEAAQAELARALQSLRELEEMRDLLIEEAASVKQYGEMTDIIALQNRVYANQYANSVIGELTHKLDAIDKQKHNVNEARQVLVKATQDKKALEIHKENLHLEWKRARKKFETNMLDDLASQSAFYKEGF